MAGPIGKVGYKLISMAFLIPTGIAMKKAVDAGWRRSRGTTPPQDPKSLDNDWMDVLAWAALSGTAAALGQVVASRGAAATYRVVTGLDAPRSSDKSKKAG